MELKTINREELYGQVWSKPMMTLAKEYDLSDNGLRKVCKRMNVPVPTVGYWQKANSGLKVRRLPLPDAEGVSEIRIRQKEEPEQKVEEESKRVLAESLPENKITVSETTSKPHNLIQRLKKDLKAKNKKRLDRGMLYSTPGELAVRIAPGSIGRALSILDALIKAIEKRGHEVCVKKEESGWATLVQVDSESIEIDLQEKYKIIKKETKDTWGNYDKEYISTGVLILRLNNQYWFKNVCRDRKKKKLEDQLNDFVIEIFRAADERQSRRLEREKEHLEWEKEQSRREELRQKQELENQKYQQLEKDALGWHKSQIIRSYLDALKKQREGVQEGDDFSQWLAWAHQQADRLDPTKSKSVRRLS